MIRAIIFDFDGVIVESVHIKTEAFKELFSGYPEKVDEIVNYHLLNGGISRFVKFRYIYENILCQSLSKSKEAELGRRFSRLVFDKILASPFVAGAKEFLDRNKNVYQFFIASGTPENELEDIVDRKGLRHHFKAVYGSPKDKAEIINSIINNFNFDSKEVVYIGDAQSDFIAAEKTGIVFIERVSRVNSISNGRQIRIKNLSMLEEVLRKIEYNGGILK